MSETRRQQKITFGDMRASGVHGLLIYVPTTGAAPWSNFHRWQLIDGIMGSGCPIESGTYVKFTQAGAELFA